MREKSKPLPPFPGLMHCAGGCLGEEKCEGCDLGSWGEWVSRVRSLSGPLAGGQGSGGGSRTTLKWEVMKNPLILGASPFHPHLGIYPAGERMDVWVPFTGRKVPQPTQFPGL